MNNLVATLAPQFIKRAIWQRKYRAGYSLPQPSDVLELLKARHNVLEMGCGIGAMLRELRANGWTGRYRGVEISKHAVRLCPIDKNAAFEVSSMEDYRPLGHYDAIIFVETIYYVSLKRVPELIDVLRGCLLPGGTIIMRIHDHRKYARYVTALRDIADVDLLPSASDDEQ
jgi:cyclopropane fatty-acyl-phospholipid synthase-like methyltransferase